MNLIQLEYFKMLANTENFTKAAEKLLISQPSLSKTIARLEDALGVTLFDRIGKKIRLNTNGEIFLEYVNRSLSELYAGQKELRKLQGRYSGELSFTTMLLAEFIPKLIIPFIDSHPDISLKYNQCNSEIAFKKLINFEIDFCISNRFSKDIRIQNDLIFENPVYVFVGKNHPLSDKKVISIVELKDSYFLCNDFSTDRYETESICEDFGFLPKIRIESNDPNVIRLILNERPYCFFSHSNMIKFRMEQKTMKDDKILLLKEKIKSPVVISRRKRHRFTLLKEEFYDYVRETIVQNCNITRDIVTDYLTKTIGLVNHPMNN
jgi:DNA-binding transcriptional LysR family regulator